MGSNMFGLLGQDDDETNDYAMDSPDLKVTQPVLLMEDIAYARAGRESIAALKKDGSVWWWGQYMSTYGTNLSDPRKMLKTAPCKVLENVRMVWPEKIEENSNLMEIPKQMSYETVYLFNTFVQLQDGTILAVRSYDHFQQLPEKECSV